MAANSKIERIYDWDNELSNAMNAAVDRSATRKLMASFYADLIIAAGTNADRDWRTIADAIIKRWSVSGFLYIKRLAWNELKARRPDAG